MPRGLRPLGRRADSAADAAVARHLAAVFAAQPGLLRASVLSRDPWSTDQRTQHEARTVNKGTKLSANFWIHMFEFQEALKRGCENKDYYQDSPYVPEVPKLI